ncbi:Methylcrotonoyl-CoA carboxylase [Carbonactinospora thermoautotrophica]|uniref:Biotin-dependent 3-methylcrotonyl-coenzyme A carboxylase alpha1 subunit n=2 Tax=Carbonactinospora thermoautotrophica TaxID=1469144 RepID=A0A132MS51_9ACTN|nr:biotin carboxylase N-terminal domain-containing protein [Carbonactinospora thermoautotrophica]KWX00687.1 Methylcrotonoyl-CoA carboxylase [Carbonactinospora thermoautotrophica]
MFNTVLVANRGEIAVRVIRTLRKLGIRSVAVYSDADESARHVREADVAVRLGPAPAAQSYLSIERILDAARRTGAQAVHPGYGFLAENAAFARACADAGLVFIGPPAGAIELMGDKIRAKQTVEAAGVPVVPGRHTPGLTDDDLVAAVEEIGYPVLLKPSAGGGGKGMRLVRSPEALREEIAAARRAARGAFGDDTLLVERYVEGPRHIEIQVLADAHGDVIHLGERECSLQRRHQKIVEEAPSPLLDPKTRARMGASAVEAARSVGYVGAGTVEFIVSATRPEEYFFLEMNTRLQVEHPVTELVTGLDLVEWQVRVAAGERLGLAQEEVELRGHAVEARVYAEDPARGFLPTGGVVLRLAEPDLPHVRVDSGLREGMRIGSDYDPMLAKVVAWGGTRAEALRRLDAALARTTVLGVTTNVAFLRRLIKDPEVAAGRLDTGLVERRLAELVDGAALSTPEEVLAAAALARLLQLEPAPSTWVDPFDVPSGWRIGEPAWTTWRIEIPGYEAVEVRSRGRAHDAEIAIGDAEPVRAGAEARDGVLHVTYGGVAYSFAYAQAGPVTWLGRDGETWAVREEDVLHAAAPSAAVAAGPLRAPMPGTVTAVKVTEGEKVTAGQVLVILEAMKMEHSIVAPFDGVVAALRVRAGQTVALDEPLVSVEPTEGES